MEGRSGGLLKWFAEITGLSIVKSGRVLRGVIRLCFGEASREFPFDEPERFSGDGFVVVVSRGKMIAHVEGNV
jgi:hypothetical protein